MLKVMVVVLAVVLAKSTYSDTLIWLARGSTP
jgi:hypothetical protein